MSIVRDAREHGCLRWYWREYRFYRRSMYATRVAAMQMAWESRNTDHSRELRKRP